MNETLTVTQTARREAIQRIRSAHADLIVRVISALLAAGGLFWGLMLFLIFRWEGSVERVLMFVAITGPGYLVTLGYLVRTFSCPEDFWRKAIWFASLVVQGVWAIIGLPSGPIGLPHFWWIFAVLASVRALQLERRVLDVPSSVVAR